MRHLYSAVLYLITPLVLLRLAWRSLRAPDYRRRWGERFARRTVPVAESPLWLHAVSVGEFQAALPLIRLLQSHYPEMPLLITTTTPTGADRVRATLGDTVAHVYLPYDLPTAVIRFLRHYRPRLLIVMETEIWPNLYAYCHRHAIPIVLANARLSARSANGYRYLGGLARATLRTVTAFAARSQADADRLQQLGALPQAITVTGDIKFDQPLPAGIHAQAKQLRASWRTRGPVWIAASTHTGEDEQILDAFDQVRQHHSDCLLILAPRHPERCDAVATLCAARGWHVLRRSAAGSPDGVVDVLLADTLGELLLLYASADVAFVGGSLVPAVGGHNLLEPAAVGLPVISGPHVGNFAEIAQLLGAANGLLTVSSATELAATVVELLADEQKRVKLGANARQVVETNQGGLARLFSIVTRQLGDNGISPRRQYTAID